MEEKKKKSYENIGTRNPNLKVPTKKVTPQKAEKPQEEKKSFVEKKTRKLAAPSRTKSSFKKEFTREEKRPYKRFEKGDETPFRKKSSFSTPKKEYKKEVEEPVKKEKVIMRLNKYLAHAGIADRRKCDDLIKRGFVKVNGKIVKEAGVKVNLFDEVMYRDKIVRPEKKIYVLLNKPKDFVLMTKTDRRKKSVMNLVRTVGESLQIDYQLKLLPVGSMQKETTGLLLLTNDSELKEKMEQDTLDMLKMFKIKLNREISDTDMDKLEEQVADASYIEKGNLQEIGVKLIKGNIQDIIKELGYKIVTLDRVVLAGLTKKDLPRGNWRLLTQKEVTRLKYSKRL